MVSKLLAFLIAFCFPTLLFTISFIYLFDQDLKLFSGIILMMAGNRFIVKLTEINK